MHCSRFLLKTRAGRGAPWEKKKGLTEQTLTLEVQRIRTLEKTQGKNLGKSRRTQAPWEEQERLERDMGIIDIARKGKKGHRNSNSRGGEGGNYSKEPQVLGSPHSPAITAADRWAGSKGHFPRPFSSLSTCWKLDTSYRPEGGNCFRVMERLLTVRITKMVRWRKSPISIHLPFIRYHPHNSQSAVPNSPTRSGISHLCHPSFHQCIPLPSIPLIPTPTCPAEGTPWMAREDTKRLRGRSFLWNARVCNWLGTMWQDKDDEGKKAGLLRAGALRKGKEEYRLI